MTNWISVKDRLPDPYKLVIAYTINDEDEYFGKIEWGNIIPSYYHPEDNHWRYWDEYNEQPAFFPFEYITHWMPLPSPPEVKDE